MAKKDVFVTENSQNASLLPGKKANKFADKRKNSVKKPKKAKKTLWINRQYCLDL